MPIVLFFGGVLVALPIFWQVVVISASGGNGRWDCMAWLGEQLVAESSVLMPALLGALVPTYFAIATLGRQKRDNPTLKEVRAWFSGLGMAIAAVAAGWTVLSAFVFIDGTERVGTWLLTAVVSAIVFLLGCLLGALLPKDLVRTLASRKDELEVARASIREARRHGVQRVRRPILIIGLWFAMAVITPAATYIVITWPLIAGATSDLLGVVTVILMAAVLNLCTPAAAFMIRSARDVPWLLSALGWALYLIGLWPMIIASVVFASNTTDEYRLQMYLLSGSFLVVAITTGVSARPGISRRYRFLQRWTLDGATDSLHLSQVIESVPRITEAIAALERDLAKMRRERTRERWRGLLPWFS
ncbi:hypothetical protein ELQ92_00515 [Labedella populi]|uniref:Uncharacterized protein n=1 Tax=Labedella populi TaxID=2498850 RepID=A0A3S4CE25_9MICO|nr:hypothetical protein [Labedella populi]RWZ67795.1 hypothetical protein ELQ92_00515 [Labedella populi]